MPWKGCLIIVKCFQCPDVRHLHALVAVYDSDQAKSHYKAYGGDSELLQQRHGPMRPGPTAAVPRPLHRARCACRRWRTRGRDATIHNGPRSRARKGTQQLVALCNPHALAVLAAAPSVAPSTPPPPGRPPGVPAAHRRYRARPRRVGPRRPPRRARPRAARAGRVARPRQTPRRAAAGAPARLPGSAGQHLQRPGGAHHGGRGGGG